MEKGTARKPMDLDRDAGIGGSDEDEYIAQLSQSDGSRRSSGDGQSQLWDADPPLLPPRMYAGKAVTLDQLTDGVLSETPTPETARDDTDRLYLMCSTRPGERASAYDVNALLAGPSCEINRRYLPFYHTPLYEAIDVGNEAAAFALIEAGADPDAAVRGGATPLYRAVGQGSVDLARALLDAGARPNARVEGFTALHAAVGSGNIAMLRLMVRYKRVKLDKMTAAGYTALMIASGMGMLDAADELARAGAGLEFREVANGTTALYQAYVNGHVGVAIALIERGADATAVSKEGWSSLAMACSDDAIDVVRAALSVTIGGGAARIVNQRVRDGWTSLALACAAKRAAVVRTLLAVPGIEVDAQLPDGRTALYVACAAGAYECAAQLVEYGARVDAAHVAAMLLVACQNGRLGIVSLFAAKHLPLDAVDSLGRTALHHVCQCSGGDAADVTGIVEILAAAGADPNARDVNGSTPLHVAASRNCSNAVAALVCIYGDRVRVSDIDGNGMSPLHIAALSDAAEAALLLIPRVKNIETVDKPGRTVLHYACAAKSVDVVNMCIERHWRDSRAFGGHRMPADHMREVVNAPDNDKRTPMHCACNVLDAPLRDVSDTARHELYCRKALAIAGMLAPFGSSLCAKDVLGGTPYHEAARGGVIGILAKYFEPTLANMQDYGSRTALHVAVLGSAAWALDAVSQLLQSGARPDKRDARKRTPLHHACERNVVALVATLLRYGANQILEDAAHKYPIELATDPVTVMVLIENLKVLPYWSADIEYKERAPGVPDVEHIAALMLQYRRWVYVHTGWAPT